MKNAIEEIQQIKKYNNYHILNDTKSYNTNSINYSNDDKLLKNETVLLQS